MQSGGREDVGSSDGRGGDDCVKAAIALGGNLGNSRRILSEATQALAQRIDQKGNLLCDEGDEGDAAAPESAKNIKPAITATIRVLARSHLYKTAPIGPPQPDYLNACVVIETTLTARALLNRLLAIENQFGRVRQQRWGARSLDLDLLLFSDQIIDSPGLTVPHPRLQERAFVLVPLVDIASDWRHPIFGKTVAQLLDDLLVCGAMPSVERLMQSSLSS
jgi:2-amino-4-hydroxy-6-hydroxymethyldihydropteridine diphosphokinase